MNTETFQYVSSIDILLDLDLSHDDITQYCRTFGYKRSILDTRDCNKTSASEASVHG